MSDPKLYELIVANECRNTHHKLVMNALKRLQCPRADDWLNLFVRYFELYLEGSKDPDTKFRDFRNHVLHVSENYWGGAVGKVQEWYATTVDHLKNQRWPDAVYSAGVLSHYYMDPIMPLHTGQTEEEGVIHRACEWSINKSFAQLMERLEQGPGYPNVDLPSGDDWIRQAVHKGAQLAHGHYQTFIDHYDFQQGSRKPQAGLDDRLQQITAGLLGYASVGFARILERAFQEAAVAPAVKTSSLFAFLYQVTSPVSWTFKAVRNWRDRGQVRRVAAEVRKTGKAIKSLSRDDRKIRELHATEVLKIDMDSLDRQAIGPVGSKSASGNFNSKRNQPGRSAGDQTSRSQTGGQRQRRQPTFRLSAESPLVDAPSIGPKTARRFADVGINTVAEFMASDPETTALDINTRHISADTIRQWQTQARLACQIPGIYGHDAQILAACGFESASEVAESSPELVLSLVNEFAKTKDAEFILRSGKNPDLAEVTNWITWSQQSRDAKAA